MIKYVIFLCFILLLASCKTVSIQQETHNMTTQQLMLGAIGEDKDFVLEQDYNHTALPKYNEPIKVQVSLETFTKLNYKAFMKAKAAQNNASMSAGSEISINYVDSLPDKPKFLRLEIADRVAILNALNDKTNADVKRFLEHKEEAHIITTVALVLTQSDMDIVTSADEVFLDAFGVKSYALGIYKDGQLQKTINFHQGIVFAYQSSNCCWQENDKYQLEIVDVVESSDSCPNRTYKSAKRAKKKINYYKF